MTPVTVRLTDEAILLEISAKRDIKALGRADNGVDVSYSFDRVLDAINIKSDLRRAGITPLRVPIIII
jgi:hypothetical protein